MPRLPKVKPPRFQKVRSSGTETQEGQSKVTYYKMLPKAEDIVSINVLKLEARQAIKTL